jgi:hypothetical protein
MQCIGDLAALFLACARSGAAPGAREAARDAVISDGPRTFERFYREPGQRGSDGSSAIIGGLGGGAPGAQLHLGVLFDSGRRGSYYDMY